MVLQTNRSVFKQFQYAHSCEWPLFEIHTEEAKEVTGLPGEDQLFYACLYVYSVHVVQTAVTAGQGTKEIPLTQGYHSIY